MYKIVPKGDSTNEGYSLYYTRGVFEAKIISTKLPIRRVKLFEMGSYYGNR